MGKLMAWIRRDGVVYDGTLRDPIMLGLILALIICWAFVINIVNDAAALSQEIKDNPKLEKTIEMFEK